MVTEKKEDGRHNRSRRTIDKLVSTCRRMMVAGVYRPSMVEVARNADVSIRSGFQYFPRLPDLHREALKDQNVRDAIIRSALGHFVVTPPLTDAMPEAAPEAVTLSEVSCQRLVDALVFSGTVGE